MQGREAAPGMLGFQTRPEGTTDIHITLPGVNGWGGERMFKYIKNLWLTISLKKKLGTFSIIVILVMGLSIAFNILIMNFSLDSFNVILNDNSLCYDVQEALEQEAAAFEGVTVWISPGFTLSTPAAAAMIFSAIVIPIFLFLLTV